MRYTLLTLCALSLAVPAKADKFWLSDPKTEQAAAGSTPNVIEGVLMAEDDLGYHVRVVGGEVVLPKQSVFRVEKDALTIDAIVKAEKDLAAVNSTRELERRKAQAAAPAGRREAVEAAASRKPEGGEVAPAEAAATYDPIVRRAVPVEADAYLAARAAWLLTGDREQRKAMRQLRRLR